MWVPNAYLSILIDQISYLHDGMSFKIQEVSPVCLFAFSNSSIITYHVYIGRCNYY